MRIVEKLHAIPGIYPVADFMAGTVNTDVVEVLGEGVLFEITKGVGLTGTSTITVLACDDIVPTTSTAVAFMYRASTTPDTWGAWTQATTTGFTTTAGSNQMYKCYADAAELASEGYGYAKLNAVEVVNSPVAGCVNIYIVNPHYVPQPESLID